MSELERPKLTNEQKAMQLLRLLDDPPDLTLLDRYAMKGCLDTAVAGWTSLSDADKQAIRLKFLGWTDEAIAARQAVLDAQAALRAKREAVVAPVGERESAQPLAYQAVEVAYADLRAKREALTAAVTAMKEAVAVVGKVGE